MWAIISMSLLKNVIVALQIVKDVLTLHHVLNVKMNSSSTLKIKHVIHVVLVAQVVSLITKLTRLIAETVMMDGF